MSHVGSAGEQRVKSPVILTHAPGPLKIIYFRAFAITHITLADENLAG